MKILEKLEEKYKELGEEIERLKNKKNKRERVPKDSEYYYINDCGEVSSSAEYYDSVDDFRYFTGNYFFTQDGAKKHLERIKTYYQLKALAEELNIKEVDWNNSNQDKYSIYMDNSEPKKLRENVLYYSQSIGDIYCTNQNFLDIAKQKIGEEKLIDLFKGA